MDIRIQGAIDGIDTAVHVRERFNIPLIYLSCQMDSRTINRAKMTMAWGFLPKPVDLTTLLALIQMVVHKDKCGQAPREDNPELGGTAESRLVQQPLLAYIAERKRAEEELRQSEQRLRTLVEGIKDYAILMLDADGRVASWTACAERVKGYRAQEILGESFARFYTSADRERGHPEEVLRIARRDGHFEEEGWRVRKDGSRFWADVMITALRDDAGQVTGFSKMTRDITDRLRSREERDSLIASLERALKDKTVLLQEVHHRVKNNLAVVGAFLRMQASTHADRRLTMALEKSQERVTSMAMIHEHVCPPDHLSEVDFGKYASQLAGQLCLSYGVSDRVRHVVHADRIELSIESAIPCGLILNEWVSNALKYGFPDNRRGRITLRFCRLPSDEILLSCHDDGVGVPEGLDWQNAPSLGLKIVQILTKQLKGTLSLGRSEGTRFELKFPDIRRESLLSSISPDTYA